MPAKHLPVHAGLNRFLPSPPKHIFTTNTDINAASETTYAGVPTGNVSARIKPVTINERLSMYTFRLFKMLYKNSDAAELTKLMPTIKSAPRPN